MFRKEVFTNQNDKIYGRAIVGVPKTFIIGSSIVLALFLLIMSLILFGEYSKKITVRGYLGSDKAVQKYYSLTDGRVSKTYVQEGDNVKEGQLLFQFSSESFSLEDGGTLRKNLQSLELKKKSEIRLFNASIELLSNDKISVNQAIGDLKKTIIFHNEQKNLLSQRLDIKRVNAEAIKKAHELKIIPNTEQRAALDDYLLLQQQQKSYEIEIMEKSERLINLEKRIEEIPILKRKLEADKDKVIAGLDQSIFEIRNQLQRNVLAESAGIVTNVTLRPNSFMNEGELILSVIPEKMKLEAVLFLPTRLAASISTGDEVKVRYDAFPYQKFGMHSARVLNVSRDVFLPGELNVPVEVSEPVYMITAEIDNQEILAYGRYARLKSGMLCEADITHDTRSIIHWVFDPILSITGKL